MAAIAPPAVAVPATFLCPVCNRGFRQRTSRNRHVRTVHRGATHLGCQVCGTVLAHDAALRRHMRARHRPDRPSHACDVCLAVGPPVADPIAMMVHRRLHLPPSQRMSPPNTALCPKCLRCFYDPANLRRHIKTCQAEAVPGVRTGTFEEHREQIEKGEARYAAMLARARELARWGGTNLPAPGRVVTGRVWTCAPLGLGCESSAERKRIWEVVAYDELTLDLEIVNGEPIWTYGILVRYEDPAGAKGEEEEKAEEEPHLVAVPEDVWARLQPGMNWISDNCRSDASLPRVSTRVHRPRLYAALLQALRYRECTNHDPAPVPNGLVYCAVCHLFHK
jgi:hypothetical protein